MELRHLRYFVTVAEELHFARVARRLHIVQPALSMQIKALETQLGTQLLRRNRHGVELTEPGRLFLTEARRTLEQAERAVDVAQRAARGGLGRVRIGYSATAAYSGVLGAAIRAYRGGSPEVELTLHEIHPRDHPEALRARRVDCTFGTRLSLPLAGEFGALELAAFPLQIALPTDHRLAARKSVAPEQLHDEPFVSYVGSDDEEGIFLTQHVLGFVPKVAYRAGNPVMVLSLVEAGLGVAVVSSILGTTFQSRVVYRDLTGVKQRMDVTFIWRQEESEPATQALVATARVLAAART